MCKSERGLSLKRAPRPLPGREQDLATETRCHGQSLSDVSVFTLRLRAAAGPRSRGRAGLDPGLLRALLEERLFPTGRSPARKGPDFSADFAQEFSDARMGAR